MNIHKTIRIKHISEKEALDELTRAIQYLTYLTEQNLADIREIKKGILNCEGTDTLGESFLQGEK